MAIYKSDILKKEFSVSSVDIKNVQKSRVTHHYLYFVYKEPDGLFAGSLPCNS